MKGADRGDAAIVFTAALISVRSSRSRSETGNPRVVITDKLRSYIKPTRLLATNADHRAHNGLNNAIERPDACNPWTDISAEMIG